MLDLKQSQQWHELQTNEGGPQATHPLYIYPGQIAFDTYFEHPLKIMIFTTPRPQEPPFIILARLFQVVRLFHIPLNGAVCEKVSILEINGLK